MGDRNGKPKKGKSRNGRLSVAVFEYQRGYRLNNYLLLKFKMQLSKMVGLASFEQMIVGHCVHL